MMGHIVIITTGSTVDHVVDTGYIRLLSTVSKVESTVTLVESAVIFGGRTVSWASRLVTLPALLVAITLKTASSPSAVGDVV